MASPDTLYNDEYPGIIGLEPDTPFDLGEPAKQVYLALMASGRREQVIDLARRMSELTIPSVMPPASWHTGDELRGNNQSIGAQCVSTLASKLMFTAFPPGQPIMRLDPVEQKLAQEIAADPMLYARIQLSLSRLEVAHRKRAATIGLATAWVGYCEMLLVCGNALWKHIDLEFPTYHRMDEYVVSRDAQGHPLLVIHNQRVRLVTLPKDVQAIIQEEAEPGKYKETPEWEKEAEVYSVQRLIRKGSGKNPFKDWHWEYWQETEKGTLIEGTEVETDYEDTPMWPGWLRPSFGDDYGLPYCEKYQGDHYLVEANHSALNDGAALASWSLTFVKPGSRTSLKSVKGARNLSVLPGAAEDVTTFKSDKSADFGWVSSHVEKAERRLGVAYLLQSAARRDGERVTAEEVQRVGQELDQAMGGLYTASAQGNQRRMIMRFIRLHEESDDAIPPLPQGIVDVQVVTGVDAMGRSVEVQALEDFAEIVSKTFPQKADQVLDASDFATRLAAGMGIKPDGLVHTADAVAQGVQAKNNMMAQHTLLSKAAGPVAGAVAKAGAAHLMPQPQQQQPQAPPPGAAQPSQPPGPPGQEGPPQNGQQ